MGSDNDVRIIRPYTDAAADFCSHDNNLFRHYETVKIIRLRVRSSTKPEEMKKENFTKQMRLFGTMEM